MLSELQNYNEEIEAKKDRVLQLSHYLEYGVYEFDNELRVVFKQSQHHHPIIQGFLLKNNQQDIATKLNEAEKRSLQMSLEISNAQPKKFSGNIMWFCSNGDIKIFSNSETLILCSSKNNYLQKINNYDYFSPFFQMPELVYRDDANYVLIEKFIDFKNKTDQDDDFILNTIYQDYTNYFSNMLRGSAANYQTLNDLLLKSSSAIHIKEFENIVNAIDHKLLQMKFPFFKLHGDLWTANILLEKQRATNKALWYIDWDTSGEYIFFYDFFKFMWNELDVNHNYIYYEKYLRGEFDQKFKEIFSMFQLEFQPEHKKSYFLMFFLNFLLEDSGVMKYEIKRYELADFQRKVVLLMERD